jgi:hypothetical protein
MLVENELDREQKCNSLTSGPLPSQTDFWLFIWSRMKVTHIYWIATRLKEKNIVKYVNDNYAFFSDEMGSIC